ncbi:MAG: VCBS repeat-containing protein [bacterium]|nr:VCBS repeat-containing protein [bacterium]
MLPGGGSRVEVGQLGPDLDLDVIVGFSSGVRMFQGDGSGSAQPAGTAPHGTTSMWDMEVGAINNDAFADVAVGDVRNGWVLLGDGLGGFGAPTHMPNGAEAYSDMSLATSTWTSRLVV